MVGCSKYITRTYKTQLDQIEQFYLIYKKNIIAIYIVGSYSCPYLKNNHQHDLDILIIVKTSTNKKALKKYFNHIDKIDVKIKTEQEDINSIRLCKYSNDFAILLYGEDVIEKPLTQKCDWGKIKANLKESFIIICSNNLWKKLYLFAILMYINQNNSFNLSEHQILNINFLYDGLLPPNIIKEIDNWLNS